MSPIDAAIIRRKLGHIMTSLDLLRPMRAMPLHEYRTRVWERKGVERVLQEAIEAALDVNAHLIAEVGHDVPDDYFGGFVKLGQLGSLPEELAPRRRRDDARPLPALHPGDRGRAGQARNLRARAKRPTRASRDPGG